MAKTYAQFMSQIEALRAKADAARRKEAAGEIKRVRDVIALYGLTAEDLGLGAPGPSPRTAGGRSGKAAPVVAPAGSPAPKFRDGAGHSWSGRGPKPGWLKAALAEGRPLSDFVAPPVGEPVPAPAEPPAGRRTRRSAGRKSVAAKATAKAKFSLDGRSWSGRGPQPRWLKDALANGKTLDDLRTGQ